jgi:multiple sugar transport system substrate-binding protein
MRDDDSRGRITRRTLVKGTGAAALTGVGGQLLRGTASAQQASPAASPATVTRNIKGTELKILQWSHFVPNYDKWFDKFAQDWGSANDVKVATDHINTAEVPATIAAEIAAKEGHDLVEHIASLAQYEEAMLDLTDLVQEASAKHGEQLPMCKANSYNPKTNVFYGFCHGYAPDPGNFRKSLWETAGAADGPDSWDHLLELGTKIMKDQGVQMGLGMSNEIDSRMAAQELMWAFGSSVQDKDSNVVINSNETVAAVEFMAKLFKACMTDEVFGWNAASNNQLMIAGQASYILNSISAYRSAQTQQPDVAKDIFFVKPLLGPAGEEWAIAHGHAVFIYQIPKYAKNVDTAKEFIMHLVDNYADACNQSELYNFPAWPSIVPDLTAEGGWLDKDPYNSDPANKLAVLKDAVKWTRNLGYPGPANAAIGEVMNLPILPNMMARAAQGKQTAKESVAQAESEIKPIFDKWRKQGLL